MSEQQIQQIMKKLEGQDKLLETIVANQKATDETLKPIAKIYSDMAGFNRVAVSVMKGLLLIGAAVGVLYGFLKYLKQ